MDSFARSIHPEKYFHDYISRNKRPEGREFKSFRPIILNVNSIETADASAVIKVGNTTAICGIKAELTMPRAEEPDVGFIVTNLEMPALCSPKFRPGPPSEFVQSTNTIVSEIVNSSKCIDLKELCIVPEKLAWVLYCDMICLDYDGSIVDASMVTLLACLKTLTLPNVNYDPETEEITVDDSIRTPIKLLNMPITTSFALYNNEVILVDPTIYEEDTCGGAAANYVISCCKDGKVRFQKFGGVTLSDSIHKMAMKIAKERAEVIEKIIDTAINKKNT